MIGDNHNTAGAIVLWLLICATFSVLAWIFRCRHRWIESYYDLRADHDDPAGLHTFHGIRWRCARCRKFDAASGHS